MHEASSFLRQKLQKTMSLTLLSDPLRIFLPSIVIMLCCCFASSPALAQTYRIAILKAGDIRNSPLEGLKKGLSSYEKEEGYTISYEMKDAAGDRTKLPDLATEIIAEKPDVVIAAGGIEADALLVASADSAIPVVFLLAASSVERKIVHSLTSSGNNFTGIDTNDAQLMSKRLWFIKKMIPEAKKLFCFHVPSLVPSVQSLDVARQSAVELGFDLQVVEVETEADIVQATAALSGSDIDVIFELPIAPIRRALRSIISPKARAENIPVFGHDMTSIEAGAFASYAGSQYDEGKQAARLVHKIIGGTAPKDIPIEVPEKFELIINKNMVNTLGLKFPSQIWRIADKIVDIQF